jgi:hypothetical protein
MLSELARLGRKMHLPQRHSRQNLERPAAGKGKEHADMAPAHGWKTAGYSIPVAAVVEAQGVPACRQNLAAPH